MKKKASVATQEEWRLSHIFAILRKRWLSVAFALCVGVAAAVAIQLYFPRTFESVAELLVMRKDPRLATRGTESGDSEVRVTEELLATHMQMLQSRVVVEGALQDANLTELPSIVTHLSKFQKPSDYVIDNLRISRGGTGQARAAHVLKVSFRSRSDEDAPIVLKAILDKYHSFLSSKFEDVNQEAAGIIRQAQTDLANELEVAEKNYEQFRQQSAHLMFRRTGDETTNTHRVRYDAILQEITTLQLARAEGEARLDAVTEMLDGRNPAELSDLQRLSLIDEKNLTRVGLLLMVQKAETESPVFQAEQPIRLAHAKAEVDAFTELQMREKKLLMEFGSQHPEIIGLRKQMESFDEFLDDHRDILKTGQSGTVIDSAALLNAYHQLLKSDVLAMERREENLKSLAAESLELASKMVADEIQGDSLRREVQRTQTLFDEAVDRLRNINLSKDYGGFINEVLAEPTTGVVVMPRKSISAVLGMLVAISLAVFLVGIAEYRDRRFRSIQDLQRALQLPVVGRIPFDQTLVTKSGLLRSRNKSDASPTQLLKADSPNTDAFRLLRTSLMYADGSDLQQVLCFTSPNPADGKSTLVGNLAVSFGQLGRRVLIIDCDLRRPTQDALFSVPNEKGLTTIIEADQDPDDFIHATSYKNVWLLPRGEAVTNPAEYLATGEFARLLESLREKYDHILLDCPPVLPVVDTLTTAAIADGVVIVLRVERTTQLQARATCDAIRHVGGDIAGIVVNGLTGATLAQEYYGYEYDTQPVQNANDPGTGSDFKAGTNSRTSVKSVASQNRKNGANNSSV